MTDLILGALFCCVGWLVNLILMVEIVGKEAYRRTTSERILLLIALLPWSVPISSLLALAVEAVRRD